MFYFSKNQMIDHNKNMNNTLFVREKLKMDDLGKKWICIILAVSRTFDNFKQRQRSLIIFIVKREINEQLQPLLN